MDNLAMDFLFLFLKNIHLGRLPGEVCREALEAIKICVFSSAETTPLLRITALPCVYTWCLHPSWSKLAYPSLQGLACRSIASVQGTPWYKI